MTGTVKKVDDFERMIVMRNGAKIPMDDVLDFDMEVNKGAVYSNDQ